MVMNPLVPQVHDLFRIRPDSLHMQPALESAWVKSSLSCWPWVVVRRDRASEGYISVGIRGIRRSERWGCQVPHGAIEDVARPEELLRHAANYVSRTPAFVALQQLSERWGSLTLTWGPTGSAGFELASGRYVTTEASDLDIAIRAASLITCEEARFLCDRAAGLEAKVDIRVETPRCGFSLEEYAVSSHGRIVLRYPEGPRLGDDPWSDS
jgi:phosphoribosyl-dephospho-CoA transferase